MSKMLNNSLLELFLNRTSVRDFKNVELPKEIIDNMVAIIDSSPTSVNGHCFSCIAVNDKMLKRELSSINKYQKQIENCSVFFVFLCDKFSIDFCANECNVLIDEYFNNEILLTSIIDATIAATMVQDYAISLDLGTCFIGALRHDIKLVQKILSIPENVIPLLGLCVGVKNKENDVKPKVSKIMFNTYDNSKLLMNFRIYNDNMSVYYKSRNLDDNYVLHTIKHYLKNNEASKNKKLDYLNLIIRKFW